MTAKKKASPGRATPTKIRPPEQIKIDIDQISYDELSDLFDATATNDQAGWVLGDLITEAGVTPKGMIGFLWLEVRKDRPDVTIAEIRQWKFAATKFVSSQENPT